MDYIVLLHVIYEYISRDEWGRSWENRMGGMSDIESWYSIDIFVDVWGGYCEDCAVLLADQVTEAEMQAWECSRKEGCWWGLRNVQVQKVNNNK